MLHYGYVHTAQQPFVAFAMGEIFFQKLCIESLSPERAKAEREEQTSVKLCYIFVRGRALPNAAQSRALVH